MVTVLIIVAAVIVLVASIILYGIASASAEQDQIDEDLYGVDKARRS